MVKTLTYVDPSSQRPILKSIHDKGARSFSDENINFLDVLETLNDIEKIVDATVFKAAFGEEYGTLTTLLNRALDLKSDPKNLDKLLLVLDQMYHLAKQLPASVSASFVTTQLKPFLKGERYKN